MSTLRHLTRVSVRLSAFKRYSTKAIIQDDFLVIDNTNYFKSSEKFPLIWLRDNCVCSECFHPTAQSRTINYSTFDINVSVKHHQVENNSLKIKWYDDHESCYKLDWLRDRSFNPENQKQYIINALFKDKVLWSKNDFVNIRKPMQFLDVISKDEAMYEWLYKLNKYGVAFLENAPKKYETCKRLCEAIGVIKKTHYGETFEVQHKDGANNVAYLSGYLQPHTDLPYYKYVVGATFLHCLEQAVSSGGENTITDVHLVVDRIRREKPEFFKILSETDINWVDIGEEDGLRFHKINRKPMISLEKDGTIDEVRHSIPQRGSHLQIPVDKAKLWYQALKYFITQILEMEVTFKLKPGEILAFDNCRVVHGRYGYQDTDGVKRLLIGHYIDWDEIYSKMRVLREKLDK